MCSLYTVTRYILSEAKNLATVSVDKTLNHETFTLFKVTNCLRTRMMISNTDSLKPAWQRAKIWRALAFAFCAAATWALYFWWRPPAPMLGLRHIEHLGRDSKQIAITFDDAPHPLTTPLLLSALRRTDVKATFFVIGDGVRLYPELAARIAREGHRLANHSHYHHNLTRVPPIEYSNEIAPTFAMIEKLGQRTKLFRPPGGGLNRDVMQHLYDNDITLAWWSNNTGDWTRPPAWKIADDTLARMRGGDIVLLHDAGIGTPQALQRIVREARKRGLEFVTMPEESSQ